MDVLTNVLETTLIEAMAYRHYTLSSPWRIEVRPNMRFLAYYFVVRGKCWLETGIEQPRRMEATDIVFIMLPGPYALSSEPTAPTISLPDLFAEYADSEGNCTYGGGGEPAALVGGKLVLRGAHNNPLLSSFPPVVALRRDYSLSQWMESTLSLLQNESTQEEPGYRTMTSGLGEVLLVQAVRAIARENAHGRGSWLSALADPQIGRALEAIHGDVSADWTVGKLAGEAAMSRSVFAKRFQEIVGIPPLSYLRNWRIQTAAFLVTSREHSLAEIAEQVGYESPAAFSRAFRRVMGCAPEAYRRTSVRP